MGRRAGQRGQGHPYWYHFPRVFYQFDQGNHQEALTVLNQIDRPNFFWTHLWSAALNGELGHSEKAQTSLQKLLSQRQNFGSEAADILSIWQLSEAYQAKLMNRLRKAGADF